MDQETRLKIAKILELTRSDNDHESLSAIRMVNAMLKKHNTSFAKLIVDKLENNYSNPYSGYRECDRDDSESAEDMIDFIFDNAWDGFNFTFIRTLQKRVRSGKKLTPRQFDALRRIYQAVKR